LMTSLVGCCTGRSPGFSPLCPRNNQALALRESIYLDPVGTRCTIRHRSLISRRAESHRPGSAFSPRGDARHGIVTERRKLRSR
jgi:hypothetical protein